MKIVLYAVVGKLTCINENYKNIAKKCLKTKIKMYIKHFVKRDNCYQVKDSGVIQWAINNMTTAISIVIALSGINYIDCFLNMDGCWRFSSFSTKIRFFFLYVCVMLKTLSSLRCKNLFGWLIVLKCCIGLRIDVSMNYLKITRK